MKYFPYVPEQVMRVDALYSLHYFGFRSGYVFPGEKHDFWELVYADMGGVTIGDNGAELPLSQGQCFLHAPNAFHTIQANLTPETNLFVVSFQSGSPGLSELCGKVLSLNTECRRLIRRILVEAQSFCGPVLDISDLEMLTPIANAPYGSGQIIRSNLELTLIQMLRLLRGETEAAPQAKRAPITEEQEKQTLVNAAVDYMRNHLDGSIHLEDICRNIGVSRTTLKRLFHECMETSVMEYYQNLRIQEACRYLRSGKDSISSIAYELGYSSLPAFSRQFKKIRGISPREYTLLVNDSRSDTKRSTDRQQ